ncbi:uncharacterized protein LOC123988430 [Osmia bicornis bicornis]|uniref:uncharacterized protein LOC123988430 n=1 Tax=Osmia bicornis bicornis TaxID=1437191 RepID=UPI001EAF1B18|nr:uncharacterized protein LOC123988430 [Osmia bicornis bicornis]
MVRSRSQSCQMSRTLQSGIVCIFRFLATGDSYQTIAFSYRLGHSTVRSICLEVCRAINEILLAEYIPTPSKEKWLETANEMWTMWNFPNSMSRSPRWQTCDNSGACK